MVTYLVDRAPVGGKALSENTACYIVELAGSVPNDIQHLAYDAFEAADTRIDTAAVDLGTAGAVEHDATLFADTLGRLSPGPSRVLEAFAGDPPGEPYAAAWLRSDS